VYVNADVLLWNATESRDIGSMCCRYVTARTTFNFVYCLRYADGSLATVCAL
jgi:hypothetical protein